MDAVEIQRLGEWFESESNAMVLYARQWLPAGEAEDVVQDVFLSLVLTPQWPADRKAWLYRVVRNRALNRIRTDQRRMNREARVAAEGDGWFEQRPGEGLDARLAGKALQRLSVDEREVVMLRIWGGLTFEGIAEVVETSLGTVFRRYRSGLEGMRRQLEATCVSKTN